MNQPCKLSRLDDIPEGEEISFYTNGDFTDLCRGGHVDSTGDIKAIKLIGVASAYYRGDEKNKQLQRISGVAFPSQDELEQYLKTLEEAKKRDEMTNATPKRVRAPFTAKIGIVCVKK